MRTFTQNELRAWKYKEWVKDVMGEEHQITVDDVTFRVTNVNGISFHYCRNCTGLLFPANGYLGRTEDKKDYYPRIRIHSEYSQYSPYSGASCDPNLTDVARVVKECWEKFIKN